MFVNILIIVVQAGLLFSAIQQSFISYFKIKSTEDFEKVKEIAMIPGLLWTLFFLSIIIGPALILKLQEVVNS
jgi:hypothetical protein